MATLYRIPGGSYIGSIEQAPPQFRVTLKCKAPKNSKEYVDASLDLQEFDEPVVANVDGKLVVHPTEHAPPPWPGFLPAGSYKDSCTNVTLLMTCKARKRNGTPVDAFLDLTKLTTSADVANIDGRLVDMSHIEAAHSKLKEYFPEHAADLEKHKGELFKHVIHGTTPSAPEPTKPAAMPASGTDAFGLTKCEEAGFVVLLDVIMLALSVLGLKTAYNQTVNRAVLRELGPDTLRGLMANIHNLRNATSTLERAKEMFSLLGAIYNAGMLRAVVKHFFDGMSWFEWMKTGIIALAQFIAWFATDGAAFVAEMVIVLASAVSLGQDIAKMAECC